MRYGSFLRTLTIPEGIKAEEVQATYRNGVLELTLPLPAVLLPKKVSVAVESQTNGQPQLDASNEVPLCDLGCPCPGSASLYFTRAYSYFLSGEAVSVPFLFSARSRLSFFVSENFLLW